MGCFDFKGSKYELRQTVKKLNGVMDSDTNFHCIQKVYQINKPSGICFRFDCTVMEENARFYIRYRVRPTIGTLFLPVILLMVLTACIIVAAFYGESWLYTGMIGVLVMISTATLIIARRRCIHRFINAFRK